jgi:hypothetical protein
MNNEVNKKCDTIIRLTIGILACILLPSVGSITRERREKGMDFLSLEKSWRLSGGKETRKERNDRNG